MRVVYFGSGEFAVPSLRWLENSAHELVRVVTQPDRPAGRGKQPAATPVAAEAIEARLPLERCENVNAPEFVASLRELRADLGIVVAFGQKLLAPVREVFGCGCVNLHASLLPRWRGAAPIQAAILAGDARTGVSSFRLVDRMDAGALLVQRSTRIDSRETAGELHDRLAGIACDVLDATLQVLQQDPHTPGTPQDETLVTRSGKLGKGDGFIRFEESAEQIARRCRAMWPWPGARCRYQSRDGLRQEEIVLREVTALPASQSTAEPGVMTDTLTVGTGSGTLDVHSLLPAGKRLMSWQDFVNGRHVRPGDRLVAMPPAA